MKKITLITSIAILFSTAALAENVFISGPYVGIQGGLNNMHYSGGEYLLPTNNTTNTKPAMRVYGGYYINEFFALEGAYDYYGLPKIKYIPNGKEQDFTQQGLDVTAKFIIPLDYGINIFGKLGMDWVHRGELASENGYFAAKDANNKIVPSLGIGAGYNFTMNFAGDFTWKRVLSNGSLPRMDFFSLGLTYRFVI